MSDKQCIFCGSRYQMAHSPDCIRHILGSATELEQLRQDNEHLKADTIEAEKAVADLMELNDKLREALGRIHAEAQVPDDTTDKEDAERVCGYILQMADEALSK